MSFEFTASQLVGRRVKLPHCGLLNPNPSPNCLSKGPVDAYLGTDGLDISGTCALGNLGSLPY